MWILRGGVDEKRGNIWKSMVPLVKVDTLNMGMEKPNVQEKIKPVTFLTVLKYSIQYDKKNESGQKP